MTSTGKRHDFQVAYDVGFDDTGRILAVEAKFASRAGFSADLSGPVADRALFQADNAYYYPNVRLTSRPLRTNTVSNTAFRGFGGPQGLLGCRTNDRGDRLPARPHAARDPQGEPLRPRPAGT